MSFNTPDSLLSELKRTLYGSRMFRPMVIRSSVLFAFVAVLASPFVAYAHGAQPLLTHTGVTAVGSNPGHGVLVHKVHDVSSSTVSHGLRITLSVAQPTYSIDGLALTVIAIQNVTGASIGLINSPCTGQYTHTEVLNKKGNPYPWPLPTYVLPCPLPLPTTLAAGKSLTSDSVVYLQSGMLRADLTIATSKAGNELVDVTGKKLSVKLHAAQPEYATFASQPGSVGGFTASIWPVPKDAGRLYYAEVEVCGSDAGQEIEGAAPGYWQSTSKSWVSTNILGPACMHEEWHVLAGWLGYGAARLDFSATSS